MNVQAEVEQHDVYLLNMGTSSIKDQASLVSDCIDCLQDLSLPLAASSETQVVDTLRFFTGDKPASVREGYPDGRHLQVWWVWSKELHDGRPSSHAEM